MPIEPTAIGINESILSIPENSIKAFNPIIIRETKQITAKIKIITSNIIFEKPFHSFFDG